ncbi:MAG TPA: methylenetetrahydrofolate reductase [Actinomycetota bacterium]
MTAGGRLAALLGSGQFCVTSEVVPPRSANASPIVAHARALVGYVDAVNLTDNPTASAHMSPLAGVRAVADAGIEPTVQLTCRDRNRLAITADLLGAWALGARNVLCLSGDPLAVGDHPEAVAVGDLTVNEVVALTRRMRDEGTLLSGAELAEPPRYLIGVADLPLADPYDPARLESKLDAGADVVWTQIAYDVEGLAAWADRIRGLGVLERAHVIVGVVPLRSAAGARSMQEHLPGVRIPEALLRTLDDAGADAEAVGLELTIGVVEAARRIDGVSGIHLMGMGRDDLVVKVVEGAGLFPRPTGAW